MTQAATFGRRTPLASAAPTPRPLKPIPARGPQPEAPAYDPSITAGAFRSDDDELSGWKSERRAALFEAAGPWRWIGLASASGTLALLMTQQDPGHIAPFLGALTAISTGIAGRRVRIYLRFRAAQFG